MKYRLFLVMFLTWGTVPTSVLAAIPKCKYSVSHSQDDELSSDSSYVGGAAQIEPFISGVTGDPAKFMVAWKEGGESGEATIANVGLGLFEDQTFTPLGLMSDLPNGYTTEAAFHQEFQSDPSTAVGGNGSLYVASLGLGSLGFDHGILFSSKSASAQDFAQVQLLQGGLPLDKGMIAADTSSGAEGDRVYAFWHQPTSFTICPEDLWITYSVDGGAIWTDPEGMDVDPFTPTCAQQGTGIIGIVDNNHTLHTVWISGAFGSVVGKIQSKTVDIVDFGTSNEHLQFGTTLDVGDYQRSGVDGTGQLPGVVFDLIEFPSIAVDRSCGTNSGNLYVAYVSEHHCLTCSSSQPGDPDLYIVRSIDGGSTWGTPIPLSSLGWNLPSGSCDQNCTPIDDVGDEMIVQFFPAITVNDDGVVGVIWYEINPNDPDVGEQDNTVRVFFAYSGDGGETFEGITQINDSSWSQCDLLPSGAPSYPGRFGEYIGLAGYDNRFRGVWMDGRDPLYSDPADTSCPHPQCGTCAPSNLADIGDIFSDDVELPTCHFSKGDSEFDCDVDLVDFGAFQVCYTGSGGPTATGCEWADFDDDNDVDLLDFGEFQLAFGMDSSECFCASHSEELATGSGTSMSDIFSIEQLHDMLVDYATAHELPLDGD